MRKKKEPTSNQTLQWISEKFVGPRRKAAIGELERLEELHGRLVPRVIVDAARDPRSPLHSFFEWNDSVAAEKYRLLQAAHLVQHVKVTVETPTMEPREVRAYYAPYKGQGYISIQRVLSDEDMRRQLLAQAQADLEVFQRRYEALQELDVVFGAINKVLKKVKKKVIEKEKRAET